MDEKERQQYSRIMGGLAWPGKRSGFALIMGEQFKEHPAYSTPVYRILREMEADNIPSLLDQVADAHSYFKAETWLGDTEYEAGRKLLRELNEDLEKNRLPGIGFTKAPFVSSPTGFVYLYSTIKKVLDAGHKRLFLSDAKRLTSYLLEPRSDQIEEIQKGEYPAIEALGYVIAYMENNPFEWNLGVANNKEPQYDPLSYLTSQAKS